jgi:transposase
VSHHTEAFVGIDTSKSRNAVAVADSGRGGEVRYLGEFPATEAVIRKLGVKLAAKYRDLTFCYEAGPTGYGLYDCSKASATSAWWWPPRSFRRRPAIE